MDRKQQGPGSHMLFLFLFFFHYCYLPPHLAFLEGAVRDQEGSVLPKARYSLQSPPMLLVHEGMHWLTGQGGNSHPRDD